MLNVHLFKRASQGGADRLDRYERMLTRGHKERVTDETPSNHPRSDDKSPTKIAASYSMTTTESAQEKQIINKVKRFLETGYKLK